MPHSAFRRLLAVQGALVLLAILCVPACSASNQRPASATAATAPAPAVTSAPTATPAPAVTSAPAAVTAPAAPVAATAPPTILAPATSPDAPAATAPVPTTQAKPKRPDIYDANAEGRAQIADALARAQRENRRVLVQWGANWCGWCHLLHDVLAKDTELKHELLYEYGLVLVDIGRRDKHMDLALSYGVDLKKEGVPYLTVLAADGSVVANQDTGSLETVAPPPGPDAAADAKPHKEGHDVAKVLGFLKAHEAPQLVAEDLYRDARTRAAAEGKHVFLHFGAPWCGWCHKLDDWLAGERVAALLGRDFVELKIDTERTIGGAELLAKLRGSEKGGIPWFAFTAADGTVLATSTDPEGRNTGFPAAPHELAHFGAMLKATAQHLGDAEIAELLASLQPPGKAAAPAAPAAPAQR
jgi:thiol-disulfide isomerase/thioredoxin